MKNLAPNLLKITDYIESDRSLIASQWMEIKVVISVLRSHQISTRKFKEGFGIPIIEFFIAVVREEKEAGNCPIMSKLVMFLLEKSITPQNVFEICMGLRRSLIAYLYKQNLVDDNALKILDEIADLFDANLSGVLKLFTMYYEQSQQHLAQSKMFQQKLKQITKIINFVNTKIFIIQNGLIIMGNQSFFNAVGVKGIKEFYEKYDNSFAFTNKIESSQEPYSSGNIENWLANVSQTNQPFKTTLFNHESSREFTYSGRVTTLPETDPVKYIIALNSIHSYLEDKTDIRKLMTHDEATGLNNYSTFEYLLSETQEKAQTDGTHFAFCVIDVPSFRDIKKQKNPENKKKNITEIAESIKLHANENMILAYLEGSKFGILIPYVSQQECYDWCCTLYMTLNAKNEQITVSLTGFKPRESINSIQARAYALCDIGMSLDDDIVQTDFKNIKPFVNLPDQKQFINKLRDMKTVDTTLYYKELPVNVNNKILRLSDDSITLELSNKQFLIAANDSLIYLKLPSFGYIKAYIKNIDNTQMTMDVHHFGSGKYFPMNRKKFRIQAQDEIHITMLFEGNIFEGNMINLNEDAIALSIDNKKDLYVGGLASIQLMLEIDNKAESINTSTTVHKIQKYGEKYKIVLFCHFNNCNKVLMNKYIAQRQIEVINEMRAKSLTSS